MAVHELKLDTAYMDAVKLGVKTFEIRYNDRNYQVGDTLIMRRVNHPEGYEDMVSCEVSYVFHGGAYGLEVNYVVMAFVGLLVIKE